MSRIPIHVVIPITIIFLYAIFGGVVIADGENSTVMQPDLQVTAIRPNGGEIFAHEPNTITAIVKNNGDGPSGAFAVRFRINGADSLVQASPLLPGATAELSSTDSASRLNGASVTVNVVADPDAVINETDKGNNVLEITKTVVNNGYKGKRYTDGSDMSTKATFSLRGDLICSAKTEYQGSGNWGSKSVTWSTTDTPIPSGATVKEVRLYVPYNWDEDKIMPGGVSLTFNGNAVTPAATYSDTKGYGGYDYPSGLLVYTVTPSFIAGASNTVTITRTSTQKGPSLNGMILVVIYEDTAMTQKKIFLNEETDILKRYESDTWITADEASSYATFSGESLDLSKVASARLITIANSAKPGEGHLIFNGQTWTGVWTGGDDTTFGIDDRQVKNNLISSGNGVQFRAGVIGDYFVPTNAILVVEYSGLLPTTRVTTAETTSVATTTTVANVTVTPSPISSSKPVVNNAQDSGMDEESTSSQMQVSVAAETGKNSISEKASTDKTSSTISRASSGDIMVPLPVAVIGAIVLVNTIVAGIGVFILINDVKVK